jgi:hypothetical protein
MHDNIFNKFTFNNTKLEISLSFGLRYLYGAYVSISFTVKFTVESQQPRECNRSQQMTKKKIP